METTKLEQLIAEIEATRARLADIDAEEQQFTRDRQALAEGTDYSRAAVAKVTELTTRLSILPNARQRLYGELATAEEALAAEIQKQKAAFIPEVNGAAARAKAEIVEALKPFCGCTHDLEARLADQTDTMKRWREDEAIVSSVTDRRSGDSDLCGSARALLSFYGAFQKDGRLPR